MAKFRVWLETQFGRISIESEDLEDVKKSFPKKEDLETINTLIGSLGIGFLKTRTPKPGFEDIYRFTPDGMIELVLQASSAVEEIGFVLFAYDPQSATIEQISRSTAVKKDSVYAYLSQQQYKDYFTKHADGGFGLTFQGKQWAEKIGDKLKQSISEKRSEVPIAKEEAIPKT